MTGNNTIGHTIEIFCVTIYRKKGRGILSTWRNFRLVFLEATFRVFPLKKGKGSHTYLLREGEMLCLPIRCKIPCNLKPEAQWPSHLMFCICLDSWSPSPMCAIHSRNVGLNSTTASSLVPYFANNKINPLWGFTLHRNN